MPIWQICLVLALIAGVIIIGVCVIQIIVEIVMGD